MGVKRSKVSGYVSCGCPTCFELAIASVGEKLPILCNECVDAGCDGESDCSCEPEYDEDDFEG